MGVFQSALGAPFRGGSVDPPQSFQDRQKVSKIALLVPFGDFTGPLARRPYIARTHRRWTFRALDLTWIADPHIPKSQDRLAIGPGALAHRCL